MKKCPECNIILRRMVAGYYGHPVEKKWRMPMDGYLSEHWEQILCSQVGIVKKNW